MSTDDEVRGIGFEPTRRGWHPLTEEVDQRMRDADRRRLESERPPSPERIDAEAQPCIVCGEDAEASLVGTPTCSLPCLGILADRALPMLAPMLVREGREPVRQRRKPKPRLPSADRSGVTGSGGSVEMAKDRLGTCASVLARHGITVRGKTARCPFHDDRSPSFSLYERDGRSRAHCHGACGWDGDAIDLEAALEGRPPAEVIAGWGR